MILRTMKLGKHWWITGDENGGPYGPYDTKAEADDDRRGLKRFYDNKETADGKQEREAV